MEAAKAPSRRQRLWRHFHSHREDEENQGMTTTGLHVPVCNKEETTMNAEQLKGKWMQFKGELKGQWGNFTENDLTEIAGDYDKFVGKVQERYGDKKSELMKWAEAWHAKPATDTEKPK